MDKLNLTPEERIEDYKKALEYYKNYKSDYVFYFFRLFKKKVKREAMKPICVVMTRILRNRINDSSSAIFHDHILGIYSELAFIRKECDYSHHGLWFCAGDYNSRIKVLEKAIKKSKDVQ